MGRGKASRDVFCTRCAWRGLLRAWHDFDGYVFAVRSATGTRQALEHRGDMHECCVQACGKKGETCCPGDSPCEDGNVCSRFRQQCEAETDDGVGDGVQPPISCTAHALTWTPTPDNPCLSPHTIASTPVAVKEIAVGSRV